ncbi:Hypothetical protein HVR_LOCUS1189 [uncultured virus]|nr:Hypothetical protein HVR_LOCUS1189 [uncultured virus]
MILSLIVTLIKTGTIVGLITVGTAGAFAYATKPDEKMLRSKIGRDMTGQSEGNIPIIGPVVAGALSVGTSIEIRDFIVFRTATVTPPMSKSQLYIGAFQYWVATHHLNF